MVFDVFTMRQHDNDNFDPFSAIGLQAALIVNKLRLQTQLTKIAEEHHEDAGSDGDRGDSKEQRGANHSEAVADGVKKIIAFEQRARGKKSGSG